MRLVVGIAVLLACVACAGPQLRAPAVTDECAAVALCRRARTAHRVGDMRRAFACLYTAVLCSRDPRRRAALLRELRDFAASDAADDVQLRRVYDAMHRGGDPVQSHRELSRLYALRADPFAAWAHKLLAREYAVADSEHGDRWLQSADLVP